MPGDVVTKSTNPIIIRREHADDDCPDFAAGEHNVATVSDYAELLFARD